MPETLEGVSFARFYRPATTATRVGGDFIDAFKLGRNSVAVALGDVSGKGLEAATMTAMVRNTLRAYAVDGHPPAMVVHRTNALVRLFTSTETFVTLFYAVLDLRTGRLSYVSAGHPDAVIVSPDFGARSLSRRGPILGAFDNVSFTEGVALLSPGECLFIYSDGVTEARGEAEMYGEKRLLRRLSTLTELSPPAIIETVFADVSEFSGGSYRDDIAMLALCLEPPGDAFEASQSHFDM